MIDPFIIQAWLAGIGISLMSAPIGCFIAWQRLVYFGDTVAHASFLGVVLAISFAVSPLVGIIATAAAISLIVASLHDDTFLPSDTLLGIIAHASLALGLVILSLSYDININLDGLLFGDILVVNTEDLLLIAATAIISLAVILAKWKALMRFVLHTDIAQVEGVDTRRIRLLLMFMIAMIVAVSIKLVGILLITSLLILPAAAARQLARSPSQMMVIATIISMLAVTAGLAASIHFDTPSGPSIILTALAMLLILLLKRR